MPLHRTLMRLGRRWSLLLLLASVIATVAAFAQARHMNRSQQAMLESVTRDYSDFAAWSYQQHLEQSMLNAAGEVLGPVNHGDGVHTSPRIPTARDLVHFLPWDDQCMCHRARRGPSPEIMFAFSLASDTVGIGVNYRRPKDDGWLGDPPGEGPDLADGTAIPAATFGTRYKWINDTVKALVHTGFQPHNGYVWIAAPSKERPAYISYRLMRTAWGDTIVYGAQYDSAAFASLLRNVFNQRELLPSTFNRHGANDEIIAVDVRDGAARSMFNSDVMEPVSDEPGHGLERESGAFLVRAHVKPRAATAMVIGGMPASRMPFVYALLALAVALSVVAIAQITRESELARAREGFVSSISHELRTPLAQIRLYLETLRLGRTDDAATRDWSLSNIDRETRRLSQLVDNVLRFSRTPGKVVSTPPSRIDLAEEVRHLVTEFQPLAKSRRSDIEIVDDDGAVHAWISPDAVRHILLNLLDNAVKFGPPGQRVTVRTSNGGSMVRMSVTDEGPGIPESQRQAIWDAFHRGTDRSTRAVGGSGIGLTIVRDLAQANGGTARVETSQTGGAVFVVDLPATPARTT
jgi:signal transduction histidine kinase